MLSWTRWLGETVGRGNRCRRRSWYRPSRLKVQLELETLEERQAPAVITVTTLAEGLNTGNGVTLRDAIQASETHTSVDGSAVGTGNDIIQFASGLTGTTHLSIIGDNSFGPSAFLINDALTVQGPTASPGVTLQRDSTVAAFRFFTCR